MPDPFLINPRLVSIPCGIFATLLYTECICDLLLSFMGSYWNQKALPSWGMLGKYVTQELLTCPNKIHILEPITKVLCGKAFNIGYKNILLSLQGVLKLPLIFYPLMIIERLLVRFVPSLVLLFKPVFLQKDVKYLRFKHS